MTVPRLEQFRGCPIGQCLGDAIGCRVEGYCPEVCQNFVRYEVRRKKIKDRDRFGLPFVDIPQPKGMGILSSQGFRRIYPQKAS
jgi:hypothetical protein